MKRLQKLSKLVKSLGLDAMLITSGVNLRYATGCSRIEGLAVIHANGTGVCFTDSRYIESVKQAVVPLGYRAVEPEGSYPTADTIRAYAEEQGIRSLGIEDERMSLAAFREYEKRLRCELVPVGSAIERVRRVKEDWEIEQILSAQRIAEEALRRLLPEIRPGAFEDELAARLCWHMAMLGSESGAMGMILISGKKTSMPHGEASHTAIREGDFVTIDFGAMTNGYFSDMTRTFGIGRVSGRMREVYGVVLDAQLAGIDAFEAGKTGIEVDRAARSVIERAGYGQYFGHGLGHSLGLEIHENPRANRTCAEVYRERDITTIEPGIYIPGEFGVRIEDMVWLSPKGKEVLTRFPKELTIL